MAFRSPGRIVCHFMETAMGTTDFTFSIPVSLPAAPLEATQFDDASARARAIEKFKESQEANDTVVVSDTARSLARQRPTFGEEAAVSEPNNETQRGYTEIGRQQRAGGGAAPSEIDLTPMTSDDEGNDEAVATATSLL